MASLLRTTFRVPRARFLTPTFSSSAQRFASSDYGSKQGGQEQGINEDNPMKHLEHPGPESPAAGSKGSSASSSGSKDGAESKFSPPKSAAEDESADVKKHNEEMANRHERSANQLSEEDNKVDKNFWKGDVGENVTNKK